jgi:methyltransferase (TIGR00027 family)
MTNSPELPRGVGRTALGVARARAGETRRPDRLFEDPYAQTFLVAARPSAPDAAAGGEPDDDGARPARWVGAYIPVRTRFVDDELLADCAQGCRQVVLVAAGLDARAYRLPWPDGVRLFELDLPEVLAFTQHVLEGAAGYGRTAPPSGGSGFAVAVRAAR